MENSINKSKELRASIKLVNARLNFEGYVPGNQPVSIDYTPPLGDNLGYTSLELLLLSLSSCVGSAVLVFLRRMKRTVSALDISSVGIRHEEHPTGFKTITLEMDLHSDDVTDEDMNKVIELTEDFCPVMAMLHGNVEVTQKYNIRRILPGK